MQKLYELMPQFVQTKMYLQGYVTTNEMKLLGYGLESNRQSLEWAVRYEITPKWRKSNSQQ